MFSCWNVDKSWKKKLQEKSYKSCIWLHALLPTGPVDSRQCKQYGDDCLTTCCCRSKRQICWRNEEPSSSWSEYFDQSTPQFSIFTFAERFQTVKMMRAACFVAHVYIRLMIALLHPRVRCLSLRKWFLPIWWRMERRQETWWVCTRASCSWGGHVICSRGKCPQALQVPVPDPNSHTDTHKERQRKRESGECRPLIRSTIEFLCHCSGYGKLLMNDGSYYEGEFRDGEIEGHGFRFYASSKNTYSGKFHLGELNGQGVMKYADGSVYEGEWIRNKKEGWSTHTFAITNSESIWQSDRCKLKVISLNCFFCVSLPHHTGFGVYRGAGNSVYQGYFHDNKRHGEGTQVDEFVVHLVSISPLSQCSVWKVSECVAYAHKFTRISFALAETEIGTMVTGCGTRGKATEKSPAKTGLCLLYAIPENWQIKFYFSSGSKWTHNFFCLLQGQWNNDRYNGQGAMMHSSGMVAEGLWVNGLPSPMASKLAVVDVRVLLEVVQGVPFQLHIQCQDEEGKLIEGTSCWKHRETVPFVLLEKIFSFFFLVAKRITCPDSASENGREISLYAGFKHTKGDNTGRSETTLFEVLEEMEEVPEQTPLWDSLSNHGINTVCMATVFCVTEVQRTFRIAEKFLLACTLDSIFSGYDIVRFPITDAYPGLDTAVSSTQSETDASGVTTQESDSVAGTHCFYSRLARWRFSAVCFASLTFLQTWKSFSKCILIWPIFADRNGRGKRSGW